MTIELLWKYIHYDVDQLTWRYGKTHTNDEENKHISQTTTDESDTNLVKRFAVTGVGKLRRYLDDYVESNTDDADDTLPISTTSWSFVFDDEVTADGRGLAKLMHWFIVRFCIWQWCKIFAPDQAAMEERELKDLKKDLDKMLEGGDSAMPTKEALVISPDDEYDDEIVITYSSE